MSNVWFCIPSKRPAAEADKTFAEWKARGYNVAVVRDKGDDIPQNVDHVLFTEQYQGYAAEANRLVLDVARHPINGITALWFVLGGDDVLPEKNLDAQSIALQCSEFCVSTVRPHTFGVMQPTGDRWGQYDIAGAHEFKQWPSDPQRCIVCGQGEDAPRHMSGAYIDRVAGSAWIGREFALRVNQGKGPLWPEYFHMGSDEELQAVATKLGVFWQRPDLTHHHQHWGRPRDGQRYGFASNMPQFLTRANSAEEWDKYKRLFRERKAAGFPGSEPLP